MTYFGNFLAKTAIINNQTKSADTMRPGIEYIIQLANVMLSSTKLNQINQFESMCV